MMRNADRSGDSASLMAVLVQASLRNRALGAVDSGIRLGGWTDQQLASIPAELGATRALESVRYGVDGFLASNSSRILSLPVASYDLVRQTVGNDAFAHFLVSDNPGIDLSADAALEVYDYANELKASVAISHLSTEDARLLLKEKLGPRFHNYIDSKVGRWLALNLNEPIK